jgi:hypothetical protein
MDIEKNQEMISNREGKKQTRLSVEYPRMKLDSSKEEKLER